MTEPKLTESPPEAYVAEYKIIRDIPSDVMASRLVTSLIHAKGNLNMYKDILTHFLDMYKLEEARSAQKGE
ncbi:MAG: hypothetical protein GZ088_16000 [Acidipila sp.]|nr:hypothetical protein [Acidipila sp.]